MGRSPIGADNRITALTIALRNVWSLKTNSSSKYGSASCRSQQQKDLALTDASNLVNNLPPHSIVIYTDGSALGNPGPAGAGAYITYNQPDVSPITYHLLHPLGYSTNNAGELWGIGMALTCITVDQVLKTAARLCPIYILTDSLWSTTTIDKGFSFDPHLNTIIRSIITLIDLIERASVRRPRRYWIPGHVDLVGNVTADALALQGSEISKSNVDRGISPPSTNCVSDFSGSFRYYRQKYGKLFPY
jgi:ribonuclease HI